MTAQTSRALTDDVAIPMLGFGTFLIPDDETADAVATAITVGYRHIDTAEVYQNERGVGEGIRRGLAANGLSREDLFVTTKLWPGSGESTYKSTEVTVAAIEESLDKLGLDYVDLYLIHAPFNAQQRLSQWRGLVELQKAGKARAIGVSNFNADHVQELLDAGL
ncbi:aldo/keto reductase [Curtobacterium sp. USHLN213]|uniref:aldo/keto reductase n=1 Tax=Curtobacterium sp. USHLN213 TaxID=3081255 RepID=UPI003019CD86